MLIALVLLCLSVASAPTPEPGLRVTLVGGGLRFETKKYHEGSLGDFEPVSGMTVAMTYTTSTGTQGLVTTTNAQGDIPSPPGCTPKTAYVSGPKNADVQVTRIVIDAAGFWNPAPGGALYTIQGSTISTSFGNLTVEEVNAFVDVVFARSRMTTYFAGQTLSAPIEVQFVPASGAGGQNPPGSGTNYMAVYVNVGHILQVYCPDSIDDPIMGMPMPEHSLAPRHRSIMAHEVAHAFEYIHWSFPNGDRLAEAIADYYAALIADTAVIGAGVQGAHALPRWVLNTIHWPNWDSESTAPFSGPLPGLPTSGGLLNLRALLRLTTPSSMWPEYRLPQVMATNPTHEADLVRGLLELDDDDNDLTNGTPHRAQHYVGLRLWHSLPWPTDVPQGITLRSSSQHSRGGSGVAPL